MTTAKLLLLTMAVVGSLLIGPRSANACQRSSAAHDYASPTVESVGDTLAFISWIKPNPGGTILHYAIVRFGKDSNHLEFTAKSPTRINPSHSEMVFRVRIQDLQPGDNVLLQGVLRAGHGISVPATSGVSQFTTRPTNWMSAEK